MTTWDEDAWTGYAATARRLDQLRRDAIAAVASQQAAAQAAWDQIAEARERAAAQRSEFDQVATRLAIASPNLEPPGAVPAGGDAEPLDRVGTALQSASQSLDDADVTLSALAARPARTGLLGSWPAPLRNVVVYLWYAALALIAIVEIDHVGGRSTQAGTVVSAFSAALPIVAWVVGWLSIGVIFANGPDGGRRRSAWMGVAVNTIPLVVGLILAHH